MTEEEEKAIKDCDSIFICLDDAMSEDSANDYRKSYKILKNLIEKQSKEIEKYKNVIDNREFTWKQKYEETFEYVKENFINQDKIKEILGIEEDINNEKLLSLLQTIVDENARLEDIEDRKLQIEYNNVFNKGVKSVEDKIKAKIEEYKEKCKNCNFRGKICDEFTKNYECTIGACLKEFYSLLEKE